MISQIYLAIFFKNNSLNVFSDLFHPNTKIKEGNKLPTSSLTVFAFRRICNCFYIGF